MKKTSEKNILENKILGEKIYVDTLSSGLECYVIPKKGYVEKQAMICTKYGSLDNSFSVNGETKKMPEGIAHFLEHKMFEEKNGGNIFDKFMRNGADCNAFTNFTTTAYYFNCIDKFSDNLKLLLDFTQEPFFTDESVEKEKGIISQEITMYDDDPNWIVYFNLLRAMYIENPVKEDIAGTVESINKITKDMLYDCYNTFYNPHNMGLVVAGDVDVDEVFDMAEKWVKKKEHSEIKRLYGDEPEKVRQNYIDKKMSVAMPLFNLGFKDKHFGDNLEKRNAETKVLLDIIVGESSRLYGKLYGDGLIDENFDTNYMNSLYYGATIMGGYSKNPQKVQELLLEELEIIKKNGIDDKVFERTKKKHIGRFIKGFNSINAIAYGQIDYFTKDTNCINIFHGYYNLAKNDIIDRLNNHFNYDNMVLSVVKP